ncbi:site-2 protease family protein [Scytonema sp. PRP1]|uniref:site-2 protease family protein n=1 Tax=Scytonema sp. PRP1 TaxID=3120513 RepID=UPI00300C64DC
MLFHMLAEEPIQFFRIVAIVIISITLHELGHGLAALSQGDNTPRKTGHLTLNPLVHMGWESIVFLCVAGIAWGQMPVNPSKFRSAKFSNILVSAAGPMVNLALGILCIALMKLLVVSDATEIFSINFLHLAAQINLMLFLFNLLPIPPLDGFHVFSELFPFLKPLDDGRCGLFGLMILLLIPDFNAGLAAIADLIIKALSGM